MTEPFRLPGLTHRTAVLGRTGSGKTRLAAWLLSLAPFDKQPYVVLDYKLEKLFQQTNKIREIGLNEIPKHPGVYVIRPLPEDDEAVETWLRRVHQREKVGIYVDEGYGIDAKSNALRAILTQGRSKRLPVIFISQRPSWISRFVLSEADFFAVFQLNDRFDRQRVGALVPSERMDLEASLPPFYSWWYDVGKDNVMIMNPVPDDATILDRLETRLTRKVRML